MKIIKWSISLLFLIIFLSSCSKEKAQHMDREFLQENINIPSTNFRTVTVSLSLSQATLANNSFCSEHQISFDELATNQEAFEQILTDLGVEANSICPCRDGIGSFYCDWESDMFTQFIYDANAWDLTRIEIYVKNETGVFELISENLSPVYSPSGNFAFIEMSNPLELGDLPTGSEMEVIYTWNDSGNNEECAVLKNIIPD